MIQDRVWLLDWLYVSTERDQEPHNERREDSWNLLVICSTRLIQW